MPGHPRAQTGMYSGSNTVLMAATETSILDPINQGIILIFKTLFKGKKSDKAVATMVDD